jgi:hypothetical protein
MSDRNIRSAIRAFAITLSPMNNPRAAQSLTFYGKVKRVIEDAADFRARLAQRLGVSPLSIAVSVVEL